LFLRRIGECEASLSLKVKLNKLIAMASGEMILFVSAGIVHIGHQWSQGHWSDYKHEASLLVGCPCCCKSDPIRHLADHTWSTKRMHGY